MKLRILSLFLCLILVFSFSGCFINKGDDAEDTSVTDTDVIADPEKYDKIDTSLVDYRTSLYKKAELNKGYESLKTAQQQECYNLIDERVFYISKKEAESGYPIVPITMNTTELSEAQLHLVIAAYTMDNPQIFWIAGKFSYSVSDDTTVLYLNSGMSAEEITAAAKQMGENINSIFENISGNLTPYDRELALHDAFVGRCEYADSVKNGDDGDFRVYTSVGGLVDNYAVCEGYSRALQILFSMAGLETYYVYGIGSEDLHMWNVVSLDGVWYHLDATWNDSDSGIRYDHFNLTESEITVDHTFSPHYSELTEKEICGENTGLATSFNIFIPESNDDSGSYYARNSISVTGYDDENLERIADAFISALDRGEEEIYLYLDPGNLVYDDAVNKFFEDNENPLIFECINRANEQIYYTQINDTSVEIEELTRQHIVCVYFEQA